MKQSSKKDTPRTAAATLPEPAEDVTSSRQILDFIDELGANQVGPDDDRRDEKTIQLVTFYLDRDEYGIAIERVREVLRPGEIVAVPQAPDHVRGVTNVRGSILPVLEIKTRMGMGPVDLATTARIVVLEGHGRTAGVLVDRIGRVLRVKESDVEPPPEGTVSLSGDYVVAIVKTEERIVILIDFDRVMLIR